MASHLERGLETSGTTKYGLINSEVKVHWKTLMGSPRRTGDAFISGVVTLFLSQSVCPPVGAVHPPPQL